MNNKILIGFDNSQNLAIPVNYLQDKGFKVIPATNGTSVLEIALKENPSIIIIEVDLPIIDGEKVFHILRNNPHTADVPFIFISTDHVDIKGFRRNVDSLILKPVKWDELLGRINRALVSKGDVQNQRDKEIEGRLSHISLVDLLQLFHLNKKEGVLKVSFEDNEGLIYIKEGAIYNASLGETEKEKALFRLLLWHDGKFEFLPKPIDCPQKIYQSIENLLMEGMRQYDEWNNIKEQLPAPDSRIQLKVDTSNLPKGLMPIIYEVLFLVDFYPTVKDLVDHCTSPDYEVYQTLSGLVQKGILEEVKNKKIEGKSTIEAREIITNSQALKVRERVSAIWNDMETTNYSKIFILSPTNNLVMDFVESCKDLPGFLINRQFITSPIHRENPFGDIATLKIYGGLEIVFFVIPINIRMKPLWKTFSNNIIGMIILCDNAGIKDINHLVSIKNYILSIRRIPILHTLTPDHVMDKREEEEFRERLEIRQDEQIFIFEPMNRNKVFQIFNGFFNCLLKDEYITSTL